MADTDPIEKFTFIKLPSGLVVWTRQEFEVRFVPPTHSRWWMYDVYDRGRQYDSYSWNHWYNANTCPTN